MKRILPVALAMMIATPGLAGNLADPEIEPEVVEAGIAASGGGIVVPLFLLLLLAAAASGGGGSTPPPMMMGGD